MDYQSFRVKIDEFNVISIHVGEKQAELFGTQQGCLIKLNAEKRSATPIGWTGFAEWIGQDQLVDGHI